MTIKKCPHGNVRCTSPDRCTQSEQCLGGDYDAIARGDITEEWKCCGCGIESPDQLRSCNCPTNVVFKTGNKHAWKLDAPEVEAISAAIKLMEEQGYKITPYCSVRERKCEKCGRPTLSESDRERMLLATLHKISECNSLDDAGALAMNALRCLGEYKR